MRFKTSCAVWDWQNFLCGLRLSWQHHSRPALFRHVDFFLLQGQRLSGRTTERVGAARGVGAGSSLNSFSVQFRIFVVSGDTKGLWLVSLCSSFNGWVVEYMLLAAWYTLLAGWFCSSLPRGSSWDVNTHRWNHFRIQYAVHAIHGIILLLQLLLVFRLNGHSADSINILAIGLFARQKMPDYSHEELYIRAKNLASIVPGIRSGETKILRWVEKICGAY